MCITTLDGHRRHTIYHKATFAGPDGGVTGLIGAIVDITERKEAEQRLAVARAVADRLRSCVRDSDTLARLGGDEFVVILTDQASEELIFHAMQRVISTVAEPITIDGRELYVTCSAGIGLYPQDGLDVEALFKNTDATMYRANEQGGNNFQFFTAEMNARANERLALENSLRRALERNEFILHYQPRIRLAPRNIAGA